MRWIWASPAGVFSIWPRNDGRFVLNVGDEALGSYHRPEAAADDVAQHATGHYAWDRLYTVSSPDLSEWNVSR